MPRSCRTGRAGGANGRTQSRGGDDLGQPDGGGPRLLGRGRLDHDPDELLGAGGAQQHPSRAAELDLRGLDGVAHRGRTGDGRLVGHLHVVQHLRQRSDDRSQLGQRRAGGRHPGHQPQRGEQAVAGGGVLRQHDVPGLLAAEGVAARPAAPRGRTGRRPAVVRTAMPASCIARCSPRLLITVVTSVSAASSPASRIATASTAMIWSPSTSAPVGVDGQAAVGVAVVRDAQVGAVRADGVAQRAEVGGPDAVVDVEPVRLGVQRDDLGAGPAVRLGGDDRRGAVGAVDHDPQPGERARGGGEQVVDVALDRRRAGRGPGRSSAPVGRGAGASSPSSTASRRASGSLCPPAAKSLMPLSGIGLCEAEIITPRSAPSASTRNATAGVGSTPTRTASAPAEVSPATTAASSISPLARGSRPTTATGRWERSRSASTRAADADKREASSGVRSSPLASPRTPSVPNRRRTPNASALAVLGRLAGLLEAVLLALDDPGVAGEEAGLLQRRAVLGVGLDQRAGDRQPQRAGLARRAAAVQVGEDVEALGLLHRDQRLADQLLVELVGEVLLERLAVEPERAGARA